MQNICFYKEIEKKPEIKPEVIEIIPDDEEVKKENSDVKTEVKESKPEKPKQVPENGGVIEDDDVETGEIVDSPKPDTSKSNPQKPLVRPGGCMLLVRIVQAFSCGQTF